MFCLISEPILSATLRSGPAHLALPGLYAAMARDEIIDLPAVRPHQRQALHAFLAQVGALALIRAIRDDVPDSEEQWAALLRGLTPDFPGDEPWTLVVADVSKPALLQPPIPEGGIDALKKCKITPDAIDMLVTSKAHDLKPARMAQATPEHWLLALLTRQTMDGYMGAGNYGIARMNGAYASRPMVGLSPRGQWGARLRRDLRRLVDLRRERQEKGHDDGYKRKGGLGLLWLAPWDGASALPPRDLDPYYVEVCRRIRLAHDGSRIIARHGGSKAARIAMPKELNGVTGDPWANVDQRKAPVKCLTLDGSGFHYRRVAELMAPLGGVQQYKAAPLQLWAESDGANDLELVFAVTVRGEGGTDGFHERRIPVPPGVARLLRTDPDPLATLAQQRIEDAGKVRREVLRAALFVLFQNAPESAPEKKDLEFGNNSCDRKAEPFLAAFDRAVDRDFFASLFEEFTATAEAKDAVRRDWIERLKSFADEQLELAESNVPPSGLRRYAAIGAARNMLEAAFFKRFPNPERSAS